MPLKNDSLNSILFPSHSKFVQASSAEEQNALQMYTELLFASFVVLRWSTLETDVTACKRFVSTVVFPLARAGLHHIKDALCSRAPKPGMRPPSLARPQTNDANHERASEGEISR
jgi:hypothetical protein